MHTETRFIVAAAGTTTEPHDDRRAAERVAQQRREQLAQQQREQLAADGVESPDVELPDIDVKVEPVKVLVDAYSVVSRRDGEVVIRDVDQADAEAEARRLAGEQADDKIAHPIHALIPDESATPPGEPAALVPHDPTPHPGYEVVLSPPRVLDGLLDDAEEA